MGPDENRDRQLRRQLLAPILKSDDFRPLSATVQVEFGADTATGSAGAPNEDHFLVIQLERSQETLVTSLSQAEAPSRFREYGYAMVLASGVGGTGAGGVASRVAIATLVQLALHYGQWNVRVDARTAFDILERLEWSFNRTDELLKQRARANRFLQGMSTKLTAAYCAGDELFIASSGESSAHVFRNGELLHLVPDDLEHPPAPQNGPRLVTDFEEEEFPDALAETIGGTEKPRVSVGRYQLRNDDVFMLCTDSLTAALTNGQIADVLVERRQPADMCRRLTAAALAARPAENVAVVLAQYRVPSASA